MQEIINGLLYDTNDAYLIDVRYDYTPGILSYCDSNYGLYMTENHRFFLYEHHSEMVLFSYDTYSKIKPLSKDEALSYMQKYCPYKIKKIFKIEKA